MSIQPMYATDREAAAAWRALPIEIRSWCMQGPYRREPLRDLRLAAISAGYAKTMMRRMRWILWSSTAGLVVLAIAAEAATKVSARAARASEMPVGLAILTCLAVLLLQAGPYLRYRRLRNWGLLAIEQALTAAEPAIGRVAPAASAGKSDQMPVTQVSFNRRYLVWSVIVLVGVEVAPLSSLGYQIVASKSLSAWSLVGDILIAALVGFELWLIRAAWGTAIIRFTASGWEQPGSGLSGSWAEVREIQIRAGKALGWPRYFLGTHTDLRILVLRLEDPWRHANAVRPGFRRWSARADLRVYGSPLAIIASRGSTASVVDLVRILRQYTVAPIVWSCGNED